MQPLLLVSDKYRRYIENIRTVLIANGFDEFENMLYDDFTYYIEQAISNCETPTFDLTASRIKLGLFIVRDGLQIDLLGLMSQDVSLNDFNNKFNLLNNSLETKTETLKNNYTNIVKNVVGNRLNISRFPEPEWIPPVVDMVIATRDRLGFFRVGVGLDDNRGSGVLTQDARLNDFESKFNLLNNSLESKTEALKNVDFL